MSEPKQVLLIDAVTWSPAYPAHSPFRDVGEWFRRHLADLPGLNLRVVNAETHPKLPDDVGGVIISGSPRDAWTDDPVNLQLCELVGACRDRHVPVLGVCYGHQILGRALGGVVAPHPLGLEVGNTTVDLTNGGIVSLLFTGLPKRLEVLSSHADAVLKLPPGAELLATGNFTPVQGFSLRNQFFGVQFHPEHDPETLKFVWSARRDLWRDKVSFDLDHTLDAMHPTPLASRILRNFVQHIAL